VGFVFIHSLNELVVRVLASAFHRSSSKYISLSPIPLCLAWAVRSNAPRCATPSSSCGSSENGNRYSRSVGPIEECASSSLPCSRGRRLSLLIPSFVYQLLRRSRQYWYHFIDSAGWQKNSISICSNSRDRKVKFRGLISLRNALPTCAIPNGSFSRVL